jgi:SH3-like domain-containing protein
MLKVVSSLLLTILLTWSASWAGPMKSIARDKVNVRSGPGLGYDVLYQAIAGYPIEVEQLLGEWVRFKDWEGYSGWVSRALISSRKTAVILRDEVNVRLGPSIRETSVIKANRGDIYQVLREKDGWIQLGYYDNDQEVGWVRKDLVWGY